jgi:ABC-type transport system involved in cytochrome c biogenesis permease subunit
MELVRQITGRSSFENTDPVGLVLAWMILEGKPGLVDWEHYAFILCDHHGLRQVVFAHLAEPGAKELQGKYVTPAQLRSSPGFDELLAEVARQRKQFQGKAHYQLSTTHLKAEEVARRLGLYDSLCGKASTRLFKNALMGEKYLDLQEFADLEDVTPAEALKRLEQKEAISRSPLRFVNLPNVPGSAWFTISELRIVRSNPTRWQAALENRLAESPERFLSPEHADDLTSFERQVSAGLKLGQVDQLREILAARRQKRLEAVRKAPTVEELNRLVAESARTLENQERLRQVIAQIQQDRLPSDAARERLITELGAILERVDALKILSLEQGRKRLVMRAPGPELRLLGMEYLEARYPELYRSLALHHDLPLTQVDSLLASFARLQAAYRSDAAVDFQTQSTEVHSLLHETGDPELMTQADHITPLELLLNRSHPFRWAWVTLLAALAVLVVHQQTGWRLAYWGGLALFITALLVQVLGFTLRIMVAGRAPVGNMYETVVFVAFLAAFFALVLELVYRRTVIAIAGAAVGALGLVLADQLPLALDPKISPLVPVLRSNFWLTVHVVTIVASYAGATLAWGLGNVSLALLAFGKPNREMLRTLSLYTYRAIQIAVILLALGTVLGAWWASEAWGRYWGWDPKEVGALIALVCYVIPLHARYAGWIKDFGLAVAAVLCYAAIILSWYVINFVIAAGLHSYGFSGGGGEWVLWAGLVNLEWVLVASLLYQRRLTAEAKTLVPAPA